MLLRSTARFMSALDLKLGRGLAIVAPVTCVPLMLVGTVVGEPARPA